MKVGDRVMFVGERYAIGSGTVLKQGDVGTIRRVGGHVSPYQIVWDSIGGPFWGGSDQVQSDESDIPL